MAGWIESALIAVVISSIVTIAGWFVAHGSERRLEAARRQEKIQDFQTALLADIRSTGGRFANVDYGRHLDEVGPEQASRNRSLRRSSTKCRIVSSWLKNRTTRSITSVGRI
jgi:hypothetical protein